MERSLKFTKILGNFSKDLAKDLAVKTSHEKGKHVKMDSMEVTTNK